MMDGRGKSDRPVVPEKPPNNAGRPAAEAVEGRGLAKGNPHQQRAPDTEPGRRASALERIRQQQNETGRAIHRAFSPRLRRRPLGRRTSPQAGGGPGRRRRDMAALWAGREANLQDLSERLNKELPAQPVRRT